MYDLLDYLCKAKYLSKVYLKIGYHYIRIRLIRGWMEETIYNKVWIVWISSDAIWFN